MKRPILLSFAILTFSAYAQIPNPGFEDWPGLDPVSWSTSNIQGMVTCVTASSDAHGGSKAARGEIVTFAGNPWPPILHILEGFPIDHAYGELRGFYKMTATTALEMMVVAILLDEDGALVAIQEVQLPPSASYQEFVLDLDYTGGSGNSPASAQIQFNFSDGAGEPGTLGAFYLVDDLSFTGTGTGITEASLARIPLTVAPMPVMDATSVSFTLPAAMNVRMEVRDALGRHVEDLVNGSLSGGEHRIEWTPASDMADGVYFLSLRHAGITTNQRLVLARN